MKHFYFLLTFLWLALWSFAQTNPTAQSLPYAQDFSGLAHTSTTYPSGWQGWTISTTPGSSYNTATPTADRLLTASSTAATTSGNVHNYNDKIGFLNSGSLDLSVVLAINTTGYQNIGIAYDIMTIRNPYDGTTNTRINEVSLQYRVGTSGAFTTITGFEYQNNTTLQTTAITTPQNLQIKTFNLPFACDNQPVVQLRWASRQVGGSGSRPSFAVDNVSASGTSIGGNSNNSDITYNSGFLAPTNINYLSYQATDITDLNSLEVAQFTIRDGGASADADAVGTILTNLSMSLSNSGNIRRVALYDGTTELGEVAGSSTVSFSSLTITAPDDGTKTFSVRVTYNATVTDNQQYQFAVTSATASASGSGFAAANAGGATSSIAGDDNKIEVTADRLAYVQNTTSPTAPNVAMSPAVTVSANDINANRDLDFVDNIRITSTGTLSGAPVDVAAVSGLATFSSLTHTATGTGLTLNAERTATLDWDVTSNLFDIQAATSATDYFRSAADGNWTAVATWESSPDNSTWMAATQTPTSAANLVTIRNSHDVEITTALTIDQVTIQSGGVLTHTSGTLTVNDDAGGDDIIVQSGGIFVLVSTGGSNPVYSGSATTNINGGGILRISKTGYTGAASGMNSSAYIYTTGSIAEYTLTSVFSASGVTYFPNVDVNTIPVFRITSNIGSNAGGGGNTVINGVFEANGNVTFAGTGTKTFRNGILGTGNISGPTSGKFIINGLLAALGGTGSLTVPTIDGLEIGATTLLGLVSDKTVTGSMNLLAGGMIELGNFDLTVAGNLTGGTSSGYVKTNGTGSLQLQNIGTVPVSFPIGNSTYNPISIANGSSANWSARVEDAVNDVQAPFNTDKAINRTWHIVPTGVLGVAPDVTFSFDDNDDNQLANPAAYSADPVRNVQFFHYEAGNWSAVSGAVALTPAEGPQSIVLSNYYFYGPVAISKTTGPLPVKFANVRAYTVNAGIQVEWTNLTESDVVHYSVERSGNGRDFISLGTAVPTRNDGGEAIYGWLDSSPLPGLNFYRIQSLEVDGKRLNSSIVRVDLRGVKAITVYPNPLRGSELTVQAELRRGSYPIRVLNAAGQQVFSRWLIHGGGMITEVLELPVLKSGVYYLVVGEMVKMFVVQ